MLVLLREGSVPALAAITAAFRQKNAENRVDLILVVMALKMYPGLRKLVLKKFVLLEDDRQLGA